MPVQAVVSMLVPAALKPRRNYAEEKRRALERAAAKAARVTGACGDTIYGNAKTDRRTRQSPCQLQRSHVRCRVVSCKGRAGVHDHGRCGHWTLSASPIAMHCARQVVPRLRFWRWRRQTLLPLLPPSARQAVRLTATPLGSTSEPKTPRPTQRMLVVTLRGCVQGTPRQLQPKRK